MLSQNLLRFKQPALLTVMILSFFTLMSKIDFIVHDTLYKYGLVFSYEWANNYWLTYNAIFIVFGVILCVTYWLASSKTKRDFKFSLSLFLVVTLLTIGGLQDILFFVLWGGGLPQISVVWWWAPWVGIMGTWNSGMQIVLAGLMSCTSVFTSVLAAKAP
jgi:hypothetical protein